jgi:DNA-binding response OmpR family regulator
VREAAGGSEALELAAAEAPHLVIVDLRMPGVSGFEVVETLKQRYETAVPVIVLSGVEDPADRVRAFEAGADDFVAKPVFISEFLKRVDAFERTRRALQELARPTPGPIGCACSSPRPPPCSPTTSTTA